MSTKKSGRRGSGSSSTSSQRKNANAPSPIDTSVHASDSNDADMSANESDLSPISPPMRPIATAAANSSSKPTNKWKANPNRRRFKLLRSFTMADFVTLGNAACGTCSLFFCLNFLEHDNYAPYLQAAFVLLPLALIFDIADGYVARYRQNSSPYGSDLDSLADVISFSVAPAVLGFTLGLRGVWDCLILSFFVCCGVSRLARYNVTAETLADASTGKVKYYQGFPVPTSLILVVILGVAYCNDGVFGNMWFGTYRWSFPSSLPGTFHPFSLLYFFFGCAMISEWKIPKP